MIQQISDIETAGWRPAIRGMRNPLESWDKSDSIFISSCNECIVSSCEICAKYGLRPECVDPTAPHISECDILPCNYCQNLMNGEHMILGVKDRDLMTRLINGGPDHRKFLRMIQVWMDISAPLYWWKEYDTYKVGTVANSCSTMHKIHAKPFDISMFSCERLGERGRESLVNTICDLNYFREAFLETGDKEYWYGMIQLLPTSYNQLRTVNLNYEVLNSMYHARKNHKLDEWRVFCRAIESLPYSELITRCKLEKEESQNDPN